MDFVERQKKKRQMGLIGEDLALAKYGGVKHVAFMNGKMLDGSIRKGATVPDIVRKTSGRWEAIEVKVITENCDLMAKASAWKRQLSRRARHLPKDVRQRLVVFAEKEIWDMEIVRKILDNKVKQNVPELEIDVLSYDLSQSCEVIERKPMPEAYKEFE